MTYEEVSTICFNILGILDAHKLEVPHGVSQDIRVQVNTLMTRLMDTYNEQQDRCSELTTLQEYLEQKP